MPGEIAPDRPPDMPVNDDGIDAVQVSDAMVATLHAIHAALAPIIGSGGVAALYRRSLFLTAASHPWLAGLHEDVQATFDPAALKALMARQSGAEARAGGHALLQTIYQVLASLIGASLTERLLRSVWTDSFGLSPAQDSTP